MPDGQVLEFSNVTKRFGAVTAVSGFSARVEPGVVTGFLGPNGAGKTTTLRILLGLVRASDGSATIGGVAYDELRHPLRTVGAVLEASSFHPGRTAANHLKVYAQAAGLPDSRVDEALATVGLTEVAGRKIGGFSLGMRQRLGLAYALIGDPEVLVLDEPANGLDPEGIKWMRGLLRELARQGRTVLVSSHLLAEVQQTVDSLLIIAQGRLVFQGKLEDLTDPSEHATIVDSPDRAGLAAALTGADLPFDLLRSGFTLRGVDTVEVGAAAAGAGVALSTLQRRGPALEEVFLDLVNGVRVHQSATGFGAGVGLAGVAAAGVAAAVQVPALVEEQIPADTVTDEAAEADAAASIAAEVQSNIGGAPGAAVATGLAAGFAVSDAAESEPAEERVAEGLAEAPSEPGVAEAPSEPGVAEAPSEPGDAEGPAEPGVAEGPAESGESEAHFAVASTGIIDIIPPELAETAPDEAEDAEGDTSAAGGDPATASSDATTDEAARDEAAPAADGAAPAAEGAWSVAAAPFDETEGVVGVHDDVAEVLPDGAADVVGDDLRPDETAPVEEGSGPEDDVPESFEELPEDSASERPWDNQPATESDVEADRFFAAFDGSSSSSESAVDNNDIPEPLEGADVEVSIDAEPPAEAAESAEPEASGDAHEPGVSERDEHPASEPERSVDGDEHPFESDEHQAEGDEERSHDGHTDDHENGGEQR